MTALNRRMFMLASAAMVAGLHRAGAADLAVPVSNKIEADGAYSIAAAPTFLDYCHLPSA